MKEYFKRVGVVFLMFCCVVLLIVFGGVVLTLWVKLGELLIPADVTNHDMRVLIYIIMSVMIVGSLTIALDKNALDDYE